MMSAVMIRYKHLVLRDPGILHYKELPHAKCLCCQLETMAKLIMVILSHCARNEHRDGHVSQLRPNET